MLIFVRASLAFALLFAFLIASHAQNAPPSPTIFVYVTPGTVCPGEGATLSWQTTNADRVSGSASGVGALASNGVIHVSPTASTNHVIWAHGPGGSSSGSASISVRLQNDLSCAHANPAVKRQTPTLPKSKAPLPAKNQTVPNPPATGTPVHPKDPKPKTPPHLTNPAPKSNSALDSKHS